MSTITAHADHATLINVFTVQPERARELADLLTAATEDVMQHIDGFISANIHLSTDGTRVVNYAQWRSAEAFQAMLQIPAARQHMATVRRVGRRLRTAPVHRRVGAFRAMMVLWAPECETCSGAHCRRCVTSPPRSTSGSTWRASR